MVMADSSSSSTVKHRHTCTQLTEGFQSVLQLKIDALYVTNSTIGIRSYGINSRCSVNGFDWEMCLYASACHRYRRDSFSGILLEMFPDDSISLALDLALAAKPRTGSVTASLSGKIVNKGDSNISPYHLEQKIAPREFRRPVFDRSNPFYIGVGRSRTGCYRIYGLTVECTITVFRGSEAGGAIPVPSSNLSWYLGELLRSQAGADVTFSVSGESIAAHKGVLATRSPVFMADFFGEMKEKDAEVVEILEMDAAVFKAMLHFIYTDEVPELDEKPEEEATALAQHLIVAADRYGLERLKVMCERRLALGLDVSTVASTLALAEQQNCSRLKAKSIEFITRGLQENISAVLATDGYKNLVEKSPLMLTELLMAAHGRKRSRSPDAK